MRTSQESQDTVSIAMFRIAMTGFILVGLLSARLAAQLVINEIDVDQIGTDREEFDSHG